MGAEQVQVTEEQLAKLGLCRFDADPEALAWARSKVQRVADRYREFEQHAKAGGRKDEAERWRKFANLLETEFIGGTGCSVRPFDKRAPQSLAAIIAAEGRRDAG